MKWILLTLSLIVAGCSSNETKNKFSVPERANTPPQKKLSEVRGDRVSSGKSFWGLMPKDCVHPALGPGVYVVGFWSYKGNSPVKSAGAMTGDKLICINGHCDNFTARQITDYLFALAPVAMNDIDVQRVIGSSIVKKKIEFASMKIPDSCISSSGVATCVEPNGWVGCP